MHLIHIIVTWAYLPQINCSINQGLFNGNTLFLFYTRLVLKRGGIKKIQKPTVDIDGNLLGYKLKDKAGGPIYEIMRCIDALLKSGFEVNVFVDGDKRHSAKRSSYT